MIFPNSFLYSDETRMRNKDLQYKTVLRPLSLFGTLSDICWNWEIFNFNWKMQYVDHLPRSFNNHLVALRNSTFFHADKSTVNVKHVRKFVLQFHEIHVTACGTDGSLILRRSGLTSPEGNFSIRRIRFWTKLLFVSDSLKRS